MRPLAVLLLVIGAIAALIFALTSIMGGGDSTNSVIVAPAPTRVVETPTEEVRLLPDMADPLRGAEQKRMEVVPEDPEAEGAIESFLAGVVVSGKDSEEIIVPGATVQLVRHKGNATFAALQRLLNDQPDPKPVQQAFSDEQGRFRFGGVQPGNDWGVIVLHEEYARAVVGPIQVRKEGGAVEKIRLTAGFELHGVVLDDHSRTPISGALIALDSPAAAFLPSTRKSPDRLETLSEADGSFSIRNIPPESRTLIVQKEGYATQIDQRAAEPPRASEINRRTREQVTSKSLEILLKPGRVMSGRVIRPDGSGVEGVKIDAIGNSTSQVSRGKAISKTNGEFLMADIGEGRYTLRVEAAGYNCDPLQAEAGDTNVIVELRPQGGIRGVVVKPDGNPLRSYQLTVRQQHPSSQVFGAVQQEQKIKNSKDGSFFVEGLKAGTYVVQADQRGFASSFSDPVIVQEGENTPDVVVTMSRGGTLVGRVVDLGTREPVRGVKVRTNTTNWIDSDFTNFLDTLAPSALTKVEAITDETGHFKIDLVTPENYQLRFTRKGYTDVVLNDIAAVGDQETDVGMVAISKGATIMGTAYLANGEPAAGVDILLNPIGDQPRFGQNGKTRADTEGRFVLPNVAAGRYKICCSARAQPGDSPLLAVAGMQKSGVEIEVYDGEDYVQDLHMGQE